MPFMNNIYLLPNSNGLNGKMNKYTAQSVYLCIVRDGCFFVPIRLFVPVRLFVETFCLIALLVGEVPQVEEGGS